MEGYVPETDHWAGVDHHPSSLSTAACGEGEVKDNGFGTWYEEKRGQAFEFAFGCSGYR